MQLSSRPKDDPKPVHAVDKAESKAPPHVKGAMLERHARTLKKLLSAVGFTIEGATAKGIIEQALEIGNSYKLVKQCGGEKKLRADLALLQKAAGEKAKTDLARMVQKKTGLQAETVRRLFANAAFKAKFEQEFSLPPPTRVQGSEILKLAAPYL